MSATMKTDTYADGSPRHHDPTQAAAATDKATAQRICGSDGSNGSQVNSAQTSSPLAALTPAQLAAIRAVILEVIDGGDPKRSANVGCAFPWDFYGTPEWDANEQRLRFCDRIQQVIVQRGAPAAVRGASK